MPAGAYLTFTSKVSNYGLWDGDGYSPNNYSTNQTASDAAFARDMSQQRTSVIEQVDTFDAIVPSADPPVLCLFTQPNFMGDVSCYGAGGGSLPASAQNSAQSLQPHGGVTAWLYGTAYNDKGDVQITEAVADLTTRKFGDSGNFNRLIKAIWVIPPDTPLPSP